MGRKLLNVSYNTRAFRHENFELMCEVFNCVGLKSVELHLAHFIESESDKHLLPKDALQILKNNNITISIVDGGWCDFANGYIEQIPRQLEIAKELGVDRIRLFLTPFGSAEIGPEGISEIHKNIENLALAYPDMQLLFETHSGIAFEMVHMHAIMAAAPDNVGIVFDPINLMIADIDAIGAMAILSPFIKHVHLKGVTVLDDNVVQYRAFDEGCFRFASMLKPLSKITTSFGIEYEGDGSPILGLLQSKKNLEKLL